MKANKDKLKIVLISHFSTGEIRKHLRLDYKRRLYYLVNRIFGRKFNNTVVKYDDISPWVSETIRLIEKRDDIELHVISPHVGMKNFVTKFKIRNVHYYIFNTDYSLFLQRILTSRLWSKFEPNRKIVKNIVKKIKPDIINLIGSDGAYFSNTVLDIKGYPIFVSLQTVYTNPERAKFSNVDSKNWLTELKVFEKEKYYGCAGLLHYQLLMMRKPEAIAFKLDFPEKQFPFIPESDKVYDFVTFAQSCSAKKGTFDAIDAIGMIKRTYPSITLNVCGHRTVEATDIMNEKIKLYNLESNIIFTDFFEEQYDLFCHLKKSRFAVLPIKLDIISGTVHQAMALGLPLVTNATTGTPTLNKENQTVLLSEIDNVEDLAEKMLLLYENQQLAESLKKNAYDYYEKYINNNEERVARLIECLNSVYVNFHKGTSIPNHLLFDENKI